MARDRWMKLYVREQVKGTWGEDALDYGYDYWYQPRVDVLVSTQWGSPKEFFKVFSPNEPAAICPLPSETLEQEAPQRPTALPGASPLIPSEMKTEIHLSSLRGPGRPCHHSALPGLWKR